MSKGKFNGFASEKQYEAVKKEVVRCLNNATEYWDAYIHPFGVYYDEYMKVPYVYLNGIFVHLFGGGNICIAWDREDKRHTIVDYELDCIFELKNFDYDCMGTV